MKIKNDNSINYYIIKHVKKNADDNTLETFILWYAKNMILPYAKRHALTFQNDFCKSIGLNKIPDIDKIYNRLRLIQLQ